MTEHLQCRECLGSTTAPDTLEREVDQLRGEVARLKTALQKISEIRDSIVGRQGFHFSEHAYPLVAVLDGVGFPGVGHKIAAANLGTLIDQTEAAEAARDLALSDLSGTQALLRARDAELLRMNDGWGKHAGRAMDAVVAEEREACAKVAADHIEDHTCPECDHDTGRDLSLEVAAAIRARDNR